MRGEGWPQPADVRFGVALPDARGAFAAAASPGGTLELPLEAFPDREGGAAALAAVLPEGADLCIRLGRDFVGPALAGAAGGGGAADGGRVPGPLEGAAHAEAAYLRAAAACRRAADDPALRGRVAAWLLEFPSSIPYGPAARRHLDRILRDLAGLSLAVAFYGAGWYSVRVVEGLKERGAALCLLDLPRGPAGLPAIDVATAPLVYVKRWGSGPPGAWIPRLEALALRAERLRVLIAADSAAPEDVLAAADQAAGLRRAWAIAAAPPAEGP